MLIPEHLLYLMESGYSFSITITMPDMSKFTYTAPRRKANPDTVKEEELEANKEADRQEVANLFKAAEAMEQEERDRQGVRIRDDGLVVAPTGRFFKTFDLARHSSKRKCMYCGPIFLTKFCYFIPRPAQEPTPTPSAADTAALDLARATLANRNAEPSQLVEVTGMSLPALLDLASPPAWPHLPPLACD
jgi:hypothetical protein